jgi:hypothetical protein
MAGELYYVLFLLYVATLTFAILNILTGVFAEEAMKVRQGDQENVIYEEMNRDKSVVKDIGKLFARLDADGSGSISWDEFEGYLERREVKAFFSTLDIDASNAKELFDLLGNGKRRVGCQAFINGCTKYKGFAKSIDILSMSHETKKFSEDLTIFMKYVEEKCYVVKRALTGSPAPLPVQSLDGRFAAAGCKQPKKEKSASALAASTIKTDI